MGDRQFSYKIRFSRYENGLPLQVWPKLIAYLEERKEDYPFLFDSHNALTVYDSRFPFVNVQDVRNVQTEQACCFIRCQTHSPVRFPLQGSKEVYFESRSTLTYCIPSINSPLFSDSKYDDIVRKWAPVLRNRTQVTVSVPTLYHHLRYYKLIANEQIHLVLDHNGSYVKLSLKMGCGTFDEFPSSRLTLLQSLIEFILSILQLPAPTACPFLIFNFYIKAYSREQLDKEWRSKLTVYRYLPTEQTFYPIDVITLCDNSIYFLRMAQYEFQLKTEINGLVCGLFWFLETHFDLAKQRHECMTLCPGLDESYPYRGNQNDGSLDGISGHIKTICRLIDHNRKTTSSAEVLAKLSPNPIPSVPKD